MLELTFITLVILAAIFCWINYETEVGLDYDKTGHPWECFDCDEWTCEGCPLRSSLSNRPVEKEK